MQIPKEIYKTKTVLETRLSLLVLAQATPKYNFRYNKAELTTLGTRYRRIAYYVA
jgi:hypothetical protein